VVALLALGGCKSGGEWHDCNGAGVELLHAHNGFVESLVFRDGSWRVVPGTESVEYRQVNGPSGIVRLKPGDHVVCH